MEFLAGSIIPKPDSIVRMLEGYAAAIRALGECDWTMRTDNTFGQPSAKA